MQHRTTSAHRATTRRGTDPVTSPLTVALAAPSPGEPSDEAATEILPALSPRSSSRRGPVALRRRPALYLGVAAAGAVLVNLLVGVDPAAQAEAGTSESVAVAQALGLTAQSAPAAAEPDLAPLSDLAASRNTREAAETAAQQVQAAADQAVLDQQRAAAEAAAAAAAAAAAQAAAEAAAAAEAEAAAAAAEEAEEAEEATGSSSSGSSSGGSSSASSSTATTATARINNTAGSVSSRVQAAANAVVSNVPGAASISLGGTRPSATDPGGHPSGNALDYMVLTNASLGDAIVAYHVAHWAELGVEYIIWEQRILQSPGGSWSTMANRGSATANHYDHVHVNYR